MGQRAIGILYGCEAPELPDGDSSDEPDCDLIARWEKSQGGVPPSRGKGAGLRIRIEREGGISLWGVWVAVGGSGEDGAPYFLEQAMRLDGGVVVAFWKQITAAKSLWDRFADWVGRNEGLKLRPPALWLTPCETP